MNKIEIFKLFKEKTTDNICKEFTKNKLVEMYYTIFQTKPISNFNKLRIAQTIYNYIYAMDRANKLLNKDE